MKTADLRKLEGSIVRIVHTGGTEVTVLLLRATKLALHYVAIGAEHGPEQSMPRAEVESVAYESER